MELKPWFGSNAGLTLPRELDLPVVRAVAPYDAAGRRRSTGRSAPCSPRQAMKDASGASQMDAKTQVTSLHGVSMLDAAQYPLEANVSLALLHEPGGDNDRALVSVAVGAHAQPARRCDAGRGAGGARSRQRAERGARPRRPAIVGPRRIERARAPCARWLIDRFAAAGLRDALDEAFDAASRRRRCRGTRTAARRRARRARAGDARRPAMRAARSRCSCATSMRLGGHPSADAVLAAITTTLGWGPLHAQARLAPHGRMPAGVDAAVRHADRRVGRCVAASSRRASAASPMPEVLGQRSLTEVAFVALLGRAPTAADLFAFQTLVGLLLIERPGHDLGAGREGRGLVRRPRAARARAAQQGDDRLPHAQRLRAWRQRLRRHGVPDRAVQGQRPCGPRQPEARPRPGGAGRALRRAVRAVQVEPRRPRAASTSRRCRA